ncbi:MAG: hypothetical protein EXR72_09275 [Myxococcales bacterium]|nr:hypothetical protein [Myxococcales bacterium]
MLDLPGSGCDAARAVKLEEQLMRRLGLVFIASGLLAASSLPLLGVGCHKQEEKPCLFCPVPECKPNELKIKPLMGDRQMIMSSLKIAEFNEGFDMTGDGKVDNKLSALGAVANSSITDAFKFQHNIIIPIELYGYTGKDSDCAKFAFYLGRINEDKDGDGKETSWEAKKADCDDHDAKVNKSVKEEGALLMNRMDDDCDGYADNAPGAPGTDKGDLDGDGQSIADGDCDDRKDVASAKTRKKGAMEICGNGIDDDCNGIADDGLACDPFKDNNVPVHVDKRSFGGDPFPAVDGGILDPMNRLPLIVFPDGNVKNGMLSAGPDLFSLNLPFDSDININLVLSGARVKMLLTEKNGGTYIEPGPVSDTVKMPRGILGGVLEAASLAQVKGIEAGGILKKENSLLDAIFAGPAATILGLESDKDGHYIPDVDVDGDGIESFWQETKAAPTDAGVAPATVDTCKDGDGTIVKSNFDGKGTSCALATDAKGKLRFVDGLSVALKFTAVPAKLLDVVPK